MAPRKAAPNTLSPSSAVPDGGVAFPPRASSPNAISGFFSRPAKWFTRSASTPKVNTIQEPPRPSVSSSRKHKISRPTDPRPILEAYAASSGSKSVIDLSARPVGSLDLASPLPNQPHSPGRPAPLGDLRSISRKAWSRSADDLSKVPSPHPSPINTSFHDKIEQYRNRSGSSASAAPPSPSSPLINSSTSSSNGTGNGSYTGSTHPFPTSGSPPRPSIGPSTSPISISVSAPHVDGPPSPMSRSGPTDRAPAQVHTRSHSFTPKLSSKLAGGRFGPPSPNRKGSWTHEQEQSSSPPKPGLRTPYWGNGPPSAGAISKPLPPDPSFSNPFTNPTAIGPPSAGIAPRSPLLAPPANISDSRQSMTLDVLSGGGNASKRTSQIVYHSGFINRLSEAPTSSNLASSNTKAWKPFKMELKGSKLFLYKPPSDRVHAVRELFPQTFIPPSMEEEEAGSPLPEEENGWDVVSPGGTPRGRKASGPNATAGGAGGRRKRAYWGRGTHPDLVRVADGGRIEKGTFEALVHESVFRTTFVVPRDESGHDDPEEIRLRVDGAWQDFASSVILCLPYLLGNGGRARFEAELLRCCDNLVSGAPDVDEEGGEEGKDKMKERVAWIAAEYLRCHAVPVDLEKWEEWRENTIPGRFEAVVRPPQPEATSPSQSQGGGGLFSSSSTQAVFSKSPAMVPSSPPSPSPSNGAGPDCVPSPNLGTFSPRPEAGGGHSSLLEAFSPTSPASPARPSTSPSSPGRLHPAYQRPSTSASANSARSEGGKGSKPVPWLLLENEGLSRDALMKLDPSFIAKSLTNFQRDLLRRCPENLTGDAIFSDLLDDSEGPSSGALDCLFGTDDNPHWLTKLLMMQILDGDRLGGASASTPRVPPSPLYNNVNGGHIAQSQQPPPLPQQQQQQRGPTTETSRTHSRSEIISVWTRVGELCRLGGDELTWRAIMAALTSRPVSRLEKVWKRVDSRSMEVVEGWVYDGRTPSSEAEEGLEEREGRSSAREPRLTSWGGDVKAKVKDMMLKAAGGEGGETLCFGVPSISTARETFESFRTRFLLCSRRRIEGEVEVGGEWAEDDVSRMVDFWRQVSLGGDGGKGRFHRLDQFMALSLVAEPKRRGIYEPHWSKAASTQASQSSLLPLLFPEPLANISLIDREHLIRGNEVDILDIRFSRSHDGHLQLQHEDERRPLRHLAPFNSNVDGSPGPALFKGGTVIPVHNGDLLLVVSGSGSSGLESNSSSRAPSRPPSSALDHSSSEGRVTTSGGVSRTPSIRVKPGSSQGLDRKSSVARRSSLPALSKPNHLFIAEPSKEPPLRVLIQAGTLDCLVDMLVHGLRGVSVSVADDNGEMSLSQSRTRDLVLDRKEFAKIWWNVFRSYVTPLVFFELLRKLYIRAQPKGSNPPASEYHSVASTRLEVLDTVKEWIVAGGGAQDLLDDQTLYTAVIDFLENPIDHRVQESSAFEEDPSVKQVWSSLEKARLELREAIEMQTMRPRKGGDSTPSRAAANGSNRSRSRNASAREPPDIDRVTPDDLVDDLDAMASAAFSNVTEEDLFITADLFEVQSVDRTGWLPNRDVHPQDDNIEIQTMYSLIQEVEPSSLISELSQDSLYRLLPPGIRSCIRAYGILRKWLISKIVAPRLGLRARQARMELFLRTLEVARLRSIESPAFGGGRIAELPCVRSFVEAVVASAILSVESRIHAKAWLNVAAIRGTSPDSVTLLLSRTFSQTSSTDPLTLDMGWLIERILELIALPDLVDSTAIEGQRLINFHKRRQLCSLLSNAPVSISPRRRGQREDVHRRAFERLNNIEREVLMIQFDHRGIKEEAHREAIQAQVSAPSSARKTVRPFQRLTMQQIDKNRRDKHLRGRMQKEKLLEQTRFEKREDALNRAMRPRQKDASAQKAHRSKKSMSSLFNFMRPISSAFVGDGTTAFPPGIRRSAAELDFPVPAKPTFVVSLVDARVSQFINTERNYVFRLDSDDGGHYLMQAINKADMRKWIEVVDKISNQVKKRRLTYIGNSPIPQVSDHLYDGQAGAGSRGPRAVFGIELEALLKREVNSDEIPPGTIPSLISRCLEEVERRGMTEVGIYRIAGAVSEINGLKEVFNRGEFPDISSNDIHAVCDVVKSWFRVLPDPVFPSYLYHEVIDIMKTDDPDSRLTSIREIIQRIPQANFDLLRRVAEHLDRVTEFEESNQMTAEALAIVFSPNLLRAPQNDFAVIMANMGHMHKLVKTFITHFHVIFDDPEEPEGEAEGDLEEDIEEEDEDGEYAEDDLDSPPIVEIDAPRVPDLPPTIELDTSDETEEKSFMSLESLDPQTQSFILAK